MSYGYSQNLVFANKKASIKSLGVALGRACIAQGISVSTVAKTFNVSRMTVYNWFKGDTHPLPAQAEAIRRYINSQTKK